MKKAVQLGALLSIAVLLSSAPASPQALINTVAGNGIPMFCGDGGPATSACLKAPDGVAVGEGENLFIADTANHRISGVDEDTGIITTVAGNGTAGFCGDGGPATSACLKGPVGVAVDARGNLFIADTENARVRRVDRGTGIITTVAGNGPAGFSGDGGAATSACLNGPSGVAVDEDRTCSLQIWRTTAFGA